MNKTFLHFRQRNYIKYVAADTTGHFQVKGFSNHDNFDHTVADSTDAQKRMKVVITSAGANTGNRGSDYTNANTLAGEVTRLENEALIINGNNLDIPPTTGTGSDGAHGYDVKVGDIVEIFLIPIAGYNETVVAADRMIGVSSHGNTTTCVTFKTQEGSDQDDKIMFSHADDDGKAFEKISKYFASVANGSAATDDGYISICRDGVMPKELLEVPITRLQVVVKV